MSVLGTLWGSAKRGKINIVHPESQNPKLLVGTYYMLDALLFFGLVEPIMSILAIAGRWRKFRYTREKCRNKIRLIYHITILSANVPPRASLTTIWRSLATGARHRMRGTLVKLLFDGNSAAQY